MWRVRGSLPLSRLFLSTPPHIIYMLYNYFIHPSNLSKMDAVLKMRMALGAAGYGVYVQLLELLRDADGYTAALEPSVLAWALHEPDASLVERVIREFGLFEISDDGRFKSPWLAAAMAEHDERRAKYAAAGRKSAAVRASRAEQPQAPLEQGSNKVQTTLPPPIEGGSNVVGNLSQQTIQTIQNQKNKKTQPTIEEDGWAGDLFDKDLLSAIGRSKTPVWQPDKMDHLLAAGAGHNTAPLTRAAVKYSLRRSQVFWLWRATNRCEVGNAAFMAFLACLKHCEESQFKPTRPYEYFVSRIMGGEI